jgi:hypothetical protein
VGRRRRPRHRLRPELIDAADSPAIHPSRPGRTAR